MIRREVAAIAITAVLAVAVLGFAVTQLMVYGDPYQKAIGAELPDKCAVPPGYTEESWREHMGHHPDRYAECLSR